MRSVQIGRARRDDSIQNITQPVDLAYLHLHIVIHAVAFKPLRLGSADIFIFGIQIYSGGLNVLVGYSQRLDTGYHLPDFLAVLSQRLACGHSHRRYAG